MENRNSTVIVLVLVILICVILGGWYLQSTGRLWYSQKSETTSLYDELSNKDQAFADGDAFMKKGDYSGAVNSYQTALTNSKDFSEKLLIKYDLGTAKSLAGDNVGGVSLLKEVALDISAPNDLRAYAAQQIGRIAINVTDSQTKSIVLSEIFKDSPFKEMLAKDDESLSIRHLFDYASSLYPLAISETRIADWYAKDIRFNHFSTTTDPGLSHVLLIKQKLAYADADIDRTKNKSTAGFIPAALYRKAIVTSELAHMGVASYDESIRAYKDAIIAYSKYESLPGEDAAVRFAYAGFLSHVYGQSKAEEIHSAISPLYLDSTHYANSDMVVRLKSLSLVRSTDMPQTGSENDKLRARQIAVVDSGFRDLLLALGWSAKEFKTVPNDMSNMTMPAGMAM
jgi:tetratricopeptide (TPR) repeat protein